METVFNSLEMRTLKSSKGFLDQNIANKHATCNQNYVHSFFFFNFEACFCASSVKNPSPFNAFWKFFRHQVFKLSAFNVNKYNFSRKSSSFGNFTDLVVTTIIILFRIKKLSFLDDLKPKDNFFERNLHNKCNQLVRNHLPYILFMPNDNRRPGGECFSFLLL